MKIEENKIYNLKTIVTNNLIKGATTPVTVKKRIVEDLAKRSNSILKTKIHGTGVRTTYEILGKNLIAYNESNHARRSKEGTKKIR